MNKLIFAAVAAQAFSISAQAAKKPTYNVMCLVQVNDRTVDTPRLDLKPGQVGKIYENDSAVYTGQFIYDTPTWGKYVVRIMRTDKVTHKETFSTTGSDSPIIYAGLVVAEEGLSINCQK